MRRPVAERFSIILSELGVGFAARGDDVNQTIRRALPALQSTNEVLRVLGDNNRMLADLARESGQVLEVLGRRREAEQTTNSIAGLFTGSTHPPRVCSARRSSGPRACKDACARAQPIARIVAG